MSLKWRLILPVAVVLFVGITAMVVIVSWRYATLAFESTELNLEEMAFRHGNSIKSDMESTLGGVKALASVMANAAGTDRAIRENYITMMDQIRRESGTMFGIWGAFEPNAFDGKDAEYAGKAPANDATGRFVPFQFELDGKFGIEPLVGYDTPGTGDYYLLARNSGREVLTAPYHYEAGGKSIYVTTAAAPVKKNGKVIGVAGGDLLLEPVCRELDDITILQSGYAVLIDPWGNMVYHPKKTLWTKPLSLYVAEEVSNAVSAAARDGQVHFAEAVSKVTQTTTRFIMAPFSIGDTGGSWIMLLAVPKAEILQPVYTGVTMIVIVGVLLMVVAIAALYLLVSPVARTLNRIIDSLGSTSSQVRSAAGEISASSQQLADGATEQAASLEETSSALEEMASMTRQNADNANKTVEGMVQVGALFQEGTKRMGDMSSAMSSIHESSEQIGRIIKTIEDIAFQTNLLALNAAVEAARAGDAGKGFAVVADEVRNLAGRSAQAARDTTNLIKETIRNVQTGVTVSADLEKSFSAIEKSTTAATQLVHEITAATAEQAQGIDQVNTAVAQMDKVTQQNAAGAGESASSSEQLSGQAEQLSGMVSNLISLVTGKRHLDNDLTETFIPDNFPQPAMKSLPYSAGKR